MEKTKQTRNCNTSGLSFAIILIEEEIKQINIALNGKKSLLEYLAIKKKMLDLLKEVYEEYHT